MLKGVEKDKTGLQTEVKRLAQLTQEQKTEIGGMTTALAELRAKNGAASLEIADLRKKEIDTDQLLHKNKVLKQTNELLSQNLRAVEA